MRVSMVGLSVIFFATLLLFAVRAATSESATEGFSAKKYEDSHHVLDPLQHQALPERLLPGMLPAVTPQAPTQPSRVVIYDNVATNVSMAPEPSSDLWITTKDLTNATRFVIKPQGVCRDQLCFPLPEARRAQFIKKNGSTTWFNLSEFARLIKQPFTSDQKNGVWYFGERSEEQNGYLASLEAPDFTLPELNGQMHSLKDFRGKKVLLVTWASW